MQLPDFLTLDADHEIRLVGHRIRLIEIAQRYQEGFSVEGIVDHYPTLNLPLVHKTVAYFLENEATVLALIDNYQTDVDRLRKQAGSTTPSLLELRNRFAQKFPLAGKETKAV